MKRRNLLTLALLTLGACSSTTTAEAPPAPTTPPTEATTTAPPPVTEPPTTAPPATEPPPATYKPFDQVEPRTSRYFIELEDTDLAADQGEQRLYNLGLGVCRNLDNGNTIELELQGLIGDARLTPPDAGQLVGAAVTDLCPQHGPLVEEYLRTH